LLQQKWVGSCRRYESHRCSGQRETEGGRFGTTIPWRPGGLRRPICPLRLITASFATHLRSPKRDSMLLVMFHGVTQPKAPVVTKRSRPGKLSAGHRLKLGILGARSGALCRQYEGIDTQQQQTFHCARAVAEASAALRVFKRRLSSARNFIGLTGLCSKRKPLAPALRSCSGLTSPLISNAAIGRSNT
jgi:hypothetical protein